MSDKIQSFISWWERLLMVLAGVVLVLMMLHICADAFLRTSGSSLSFHSLILVSAWYMVAVTYLPMPHTGGGPGHLSVDIVAQFFPRPFRRVTEYGATLITLIYFLLLGYLTLTEAIHQTAAGEIWETSTGYIAVWPARWVLPVAFFAMALREALRLLIGPTDSSAGPAATGEGA